MNRLQPYFHDFKQCNNRIKVIAVILYRLRYRFADRLVTGGMHHGEDVIFSKQSINGDAIRSIICRILGFCP